MSVSVYLPFALRMECKNSKNLAVSARTVRAALEELEQSQPSLYRNICDETGAVRRHIHLFVNLARIQELQGLDTPLAPGDELFVMTAVSGG